jgi:serine phosphatase RsbU (regulator of sigma subunit)
MITKYFFFLSFLTISILASAQGHLQFSGTILGYHYDPDIKILQKKKSIEIEGSLADVQMNVVVNGEIENTTFTNKGGQFSLQLDKGTKSYIRYFKEGYGSSSIVVDLNNVNDENSNSILYLENIELILNGVKNERPIDNGKPFGRIYFDSNLKVFKFQSYDIKEKSSVLQRKDKDRSAYDLIISSIKKNELNNLNTDGTVSDNKKNGSSTNTTTNNPELTDDLKDSVFSTLEKKYSPMNFSGLFKKDFKSEDVGKWRDRINKAWEELEVKKREAKTAEDSLLITMQQRLLENAEAQLKSNEDRIKLQDEKLTAQRTQNRYLIFLLIAGLLIGALIVFGWYKNKKLNEQLSAKNQKISESISYAEHIQGSILWPMEKVNTAVPDSFILWQPLDRVGGDFYWFSKKDDIVYFSAVDCTGHGVPGGFMSMISNTLLNEIVNERELSETDEILNELNLKIRKALQQEADDSLSQEGMDLAFCKWDKKQNKLQFSGAMNPLYLVRNSELIEYKADLKGIGGISRRRKEKPFKKQEVELKKGDCIYLFSDGYMDQFGGNNKEKFNSDRFKKLLCDMHTLGMQDQKNKLVKELENWMGDQEQIDDILVMGIKV